MINALLDSLFIDETEIMKNGYYYLIEVLFPDGRVSPMVASNISSFFDELYNSGQKFVHAYWGMRPI